MKYQSRNQADNTEAQNILHYGMKSININVVIKENKQKEIV